MISVVDRYLKNSSLLKIYQILMFRPDPDPTRFWKSSPALTLFWKPNPDQTIFWKPDPALILFWSPDPDPTLLWKPDPDSTLFRKPEPPPAGWNIWQSYRFVCQHLELLGKHGKLPLHVLKRIKYTHTGCPVYRVYKTVDSLYIFFVSWQNMINILHKVRQGAQRNNFAWRSN